MNDISGKLDVLYDEFRDAKLNQNYYAKRLASARFRLKILDVFLALFTVGSGVLGFSLWSVVLWGIPVGQLLLGALAGVAVVASIARPYLKLEDELERLSSIQGTYSSIAHILEDIVSNTKANRTLASDYDASFKGGVANLVEI